MPLVATRGAASAQGFGEFAQSAAPNYIEDVFSTFLYSGNASTRSINNGIDLAGKGGIVLFKARNSATNWNLYSTTSASPWDWLSTLSTDPIQTGGSNRLQSFNSNGFSLGSDYPNWSGYDFASWTFRKQPKFFDVVTYTGNNSAQTISHNLGSVPGVIITKAINASGQWSVYHRSLGKDAAMFLNLTDASGTYTNYWGASAPTATTFQLSSGSYENNQPGTTYVAYLFAHDAGGFGLTGTDNVISCGSYTGTGAAGNPITLGYEPQYLLIKPSSMSGGWWVLDNMRPGGLQPNSTNAESTSVGSPTLTVQPTATGFSFVDATLNDSGQTFIYIAIRRGPMRTPTTGTSVFDPEAYSGTGTSTIQTLTTNFPVDAYIQTSRQDGTTNRRFGSRLTGQEKYLLTDLTAAEQTIGSGNGVNNTVGFASNTGIGVQGDWNNPSSPAYSPYIIWNFRRAPGFFDVVCYTGNNVYQQAQTHNLGVAPELIIVKRRNATANWAVGCNFTNTEFQYLNLNSGADGGNTNAYTTGGFFGGRPTATTFILAQNSITNASGGTYVAYLFATLAGVSKVGTYTGTGALQTINCGFTSGARFVLIKRLGDNVDPGTGDWYVYDSARGISSGNDPYLFLNSTAAEVTGTNYVDTTSVGFQVTAAAPAGLNANGGTYIFLAIA